MTLQFDRDEFEDWRELPITSHEDAARQYHADLLKTLMPAAAPDQAQASAQAGGARPAPAVINRVQQLEGQ